MMAGLKKILSKQKAEVNNQKFFFKQNLIGSFLLTQKREKIWPKIYR